MGQGGGGGGGSAGAESRLDYSGWDNGITDQEGWNPLPPLPDYADPGDTFFPHMGYSDDRDGDRDVAPPPTPALAVPLVLTASAAGPGTLVWQATVGVVITATLPEWLAAATILGLVVVAVGAGVYVMSAIDEDGNPIGPDHPDWDPYNPAHAWEHVSGPDARNGMDGYEQGRVWLDGARDLARLRNLYRPRDYRSLEEQSMRKMIDELLKEFDEINQFIDMFVDMFIPTEGWGFSDAGYGMNAGQGSDSGNGSGTGTNNGAGGSSGGVESDCPDICLTFLDWMPGGHSNGPIAPIPPPQPKVMALVRLVSAVNELNLHLAR